VEATNNPPYLFDRPPAEGRKQAVGFVSEALSTRA
jgi:hypothetical protein